MTVILLSFCIVLLLALRAVYRNKISVAEGCGIAIGAFVCAIVFALITGIVALMEFVRRALA